MEHLDLLFRARINIPRACAMAGMAQCEESWEAMKIEFREWCQGVPYDPDFYNANMRM